MKYIKTFEQFLNENVEAINEYRQDTLDITYEMEFEGQLDNAKLKEMQEEMESFTVIDRLGYNNDGREVTVLSGWVKGKQLNKNKYSILVSLETWPDRHILKGSNITGKRNLKKWILGHIGEKPKKVEVSARKGSFSQSR